MEDDRNIFVKRRRPPILQYKTNIKSIISTYSNAIKQARLYRSRYTFQLTQSMSFSPSWWRMMRWLMEMTQNLMRTLGDKRVRERKERTAAEGCKDYRELSPSGRKRWVGGKSPGDWYGGGWGKGKYKWIRRKHWGWVRYGKQGRRLFHLNSQQDCKATGAMMSKMEIILNMLQT